ncbi:MAG: MiaB/RimO family radical SAM methylthiotransferase [Candidatus Eremiobacteraeota bacterium]|nr:MiaB/RimO family radical SAM methylthiotransferase [Candidatus Eremiobacteraeota bacterium]MBV8355474.1 MiaB/RimO family radical SAM methylthiotransferase [Candidatus Eremiobacteraeota bacterium]
MNEGDSQEIAERALAAGYTIAERPQDASVLVVNTCTVRESAETRAYGRINHFKVLKEIDPSRRVVVAGCLAEQDRDRMQRLAPHVDAIFGTKEIAQMGEAIAAWRSEFGEVIREPEQDPELLLPLGGTADCVADAYSHLRAFVTVQRGCSYYCTFCIVPHVRGRFDHRPLAEIVADVRHRIAAGAREITLVGQTVNAYRDPGGAADFADLLQIVAGIEGLERLTFVTSHPKDFTEKLARVLGRLPALNPRLHLPMQSGSNPVLRRMNRKYTIEEYLAKVALFREHCDPATWALTTDLIVGFPGESAEDFERTLEVCAQGLFAQAFTFVYSPRRGTPAARWEQVPPDVGNARLRALVAVVDEGVVAHHRRKVGTMVRALIVGPSKKDRSKIAAKSLDNVTIIAPDVEGELDVPRPHEPWLDVRIESAHRWGCSGTIVARAAHFDGPSRPVAAPTFDLICGIRG